MKDDFDRNQGFDTPEVKRRYTPEEAGHDKNRKPVSRMSRRRRRPLNPGILLVVLVFVAVTIVCAFILLKGEEQPSVIFDTDVTTADADDVTSEPFDDGLDYYTVTLPHSLIYCGDLVLVNAYNEYYFPESAENSITDIATSKNDYYLLSSYSTKLSKTVIGALNSMCADWYAETGFSYLQVNSAYRSKEDQINIYADYTESYGEDYAKAYVADPGFSEHHTGLAVDLNVNRNGAIEYVESCAECSWFRENCKKYGFILRYPEDKVYMTGINYESWHYRYVGTPHAELISDLDLCLEEYEEYIKNYTYDTVCLLVDDSGTVASVEASDLTDSGTVIYYAKAADGETEIKIPKGRSYSVSGNNTDGFIVTVK